MNSLLRVVLKNSKLNPLTQSKLLRYNSFRQYSINPSQRYSRRLIDQSVLTARSATVLCRNKYPASLPSGSRAFSATFSEDESDDDDDEKVDDLPATVAVPEVWPHLPVIAMTGPPVFPRFMKIIEVWLLHH